MTDRLAVSSLRNQSLLLLGIIPALLLMAGYVGLTVVFFLPLLGLRRVFRRHPHLRSSDGMTMPHSARVWGTSRTRRPAADGDERTIEVLMQPEGGTR